MTKVTRPDRRFPQADREAWITLALYGLYFVWWYVCAYGLGGGDPEGYSYVFGLPAWFFYGCVLGYPVLTLLLWIVIRCCFRDLSLEAEEEAPSCCSGEPGPGEGAAANPGQDGGGCQ